MKKVNHALIFIVSVVLFWVNISCEKELEEKYDVFILTLHSETYNPIQVGRTLEIAYELSNTNIDSLSLLVDNQIVAFSSDTIGSFFYSFDCAGTYFLQVDIYRNNKVVASSYVYEVLATNNLISNFLVRFLRYDSNPQVFVGESLKLLIRSRMDMYDELLTKATVYFNGDSLDTFTTAPPWSLITPETSSVGNLVEIEITDTLACTYRIKFPIEVPENTPPEITLSIFPKYFLSEDYYYPWHTPQLSLEGRDNTMVSHADFYINGSYFGTKEIDEKIFYSEIYDVEGLSAGIHDVYCIAYDDRGLSTVSNQVTLVVYEGCEQEENIVEVARASGNKVYAISSGKLMLIDYNHLCNIAFFELPDNTATSMAYAREAGKIFIGFENGDIVRFEEASGQFYPVFSDPSIVNIQDMDVDYESSKLLFVSASHLHMYNLMNETLATVSPPVFQGSKLIINKDSKFLITGGKLNSSGFNLYRYYYGHNGLVPTDDNVFFAQTYFKRLSKRPGYNQFVTSARYGSHAYGFFDYEHTGTFRPGLNDSGMGYSVSGVYSADGSNFYISKGFYIYECDANTYELTRRFDVPERNPRFMMPNEYGNKLLVVHSGGKLVIVDL
ncbi:MAG: hypothetical protein EA361_07680 [Bacteroidetes bacterium]|nr:MAG: hypothetical protein EA361_07680 [Bacteroidota bacterium]